MNKIRFLIASLVAKTAQITIKLLSVFLKKDGTYFPGIIALKICPDYLMYAKKPKIIIGVTGTNGKTTTCNLLIDILEKNNYKVLNNRTGTNVYSGIVSAFACNYSKKDIAILEIDERSSIHIYKYLKPNYIVVTNLFRDSIRRNAHPEFIADIINRSIPPESTLIVNGDDLICSNLRPDNKKIYYAIDKLDTDKLESDSIVKDIIVCPVCYTKLSYEYARYHHIGKAYCPNCSYKSPEADYLVSNINFDDEKITIKHSSKESTFKLVANSIFNIYNTLAAISVLSEVGLESDNINNALKDIKLVETRYTKEIIKGVELINHLAKGQNPVACSRVYDYVKSESGMKEVILIEDDPDDNKKSSENITWLYDTDFESLNDDSIKKIIIGGIRSKDYYLRLLLAGVQQEKLIQVEEELDVSNYLDIRGTDKIFLLHDLRKNDLSFKVKEKIVKRLLEDTTNDN